MALWRLLKVRAIKGVRPGAGSADAEQDHLQRSHCLQVRGVMSFDRGQVTYIFPQRGHINAWAHDSPGLARSAIWNRIIAGEKRYLVGRQGEIWVIQTDKEFLDYGNASFRSPGPAGLRSGLLVYLHEVLLHNWTIVQPRTLQSSSLQSGGPSRRRQAHARH